MMSVIPTITILDPPKKNKTNLDLATPIKRAHTKVKLFTRRSKRKSPLKTEENKTEEVLKILPGILKKEFKANGNKNLLDFLCKTIIIQSGTEHTDSGEKVAAKGDLPKRPRADSEEKGTENPYREQDLAPVGKSQIFTRYAYLEHEIRIKDESLLEDHSQLSKTQGEWR